MSDMTLPFDSAERKSFPMSQGLLKYCPAALAGVARHSMVNNEKHNPGEPMHHARGKSGDHEDCILRHLVDLADIRARIDRGLGVGADLTALLTEADALAWRALMLSQELHERFGGAPLAPNAKLPRSAEGEITIRDPACRCNWPDCRCIELCPEAKNAER